MNKKDRDYVTLSELAKEMGTTRDTLYFRIKKAEKEYNKKNGFGYDVTKYYSCKILSHYTGKTSKIIIYNKFKQKFLDSINAYIKPSKRIYKANKQFVKTYYWTKDTAYCYSINSKCKICDIAKFCPSILGECKINLISKEIYKQIGSPPEEMIL